MKRVVTVLPIAMALAGCANRGLSAAKEVEHVPPELTITEPARGTIAGDVQVVEVKGTASDAGSGLKSVTVNGATADVAADGSFSAVVPVQPGITLLQTTATDNDGNTKSDARSVMSGALADPTAAVANGLAARINAQTLTALGDIGAEEIQAMDIGADLQPYNPVVSKGGSCLGVQVSVDSISKSNVILVLTPVDGGIAFDATIDNLDVEMTADFDAVCIGGSAGISLLADSYHLTGTFALDVQNGQVVSGVPNAYGQFQNFQLSVGIIPSSVINLIPNIDQTVADAITSQLQQKVPNLVTTYLGGYGYTKAITVLGMELDATVTPTAIDFTPTGGTLTMTTNFAIKDHPSVSGYPLIAAPLPDMPDTEAPGAGFRLAVNDNSLNQLFDALWSTGMIDRTIDLSSDTTNSTGLAGLVDSVQLYLPYPPVVSSQMSGAAATISIGDLEVTAMKNGQPVTKIALNAQLGLEPYVDANNAIRLQVTNPTAYLSVINDGTITGPNPLNDSNLEALGGYVVAHASTMVDSLVGAIPVPQFQSAQITNLSAFSAPTGGYVELGGNVVAQ
ncbi:MAG TPA: hypothetical protein VMV18_06355 [bacterium]|nr:hypothetical protein [bacterium]